MNKKITIIKRFSLQNVLLFSFLLLGLDILNLYKFNNTNHNFIEVKVWFPSVLGILLLFTAVSRIERREEKLGISFFGIAFLLDSLASLFGIRSILFLALGLEIIAIYYFYLVFKKEN